MTQSNEPTIYSMNYIITKFMGYDKVTVGYAGTEEETEWQRNHEEWMNRVGIEKVGDYIVNVNEDKWFEWNDVAYHREWNWLKPVIDEISQYILVHPERVKPVIDMKIVVSIQAAHEKVYKFCKWFNQQKQKYGDQEATDI